MSESNSSNQKANEIFTQIYNLSQIKKIDEQSILNLFKDAISKVILEQYDEEAELEFIFDNENHKFNIINHNKTVVDDPMNDEEKDMLTPCVEVAFSEAQKINEDIEVGDHISEEIDFEAFTKRDYIKILSVFNQSLRELEKQLVCQKYFERIGEITKAKITSFNKSGIMLELIDGTEAYMPPSSTNHRFISKLKPGDVIDVYVEEVKPESKHAQVIVSSVESKLIQNLMAKEIPEVAEGFIEIIKIARIPGERAKIAIRKSEDAPEGMEELGAIIGTNSERIEAISRQLKGEKIDVILYSNDLETYIKNAISPSKVIDVIKVAEAKGKFPSYIVVVPYTQHTLAIGKKGQNVTLASELTKARLDILSQAQADEKGILYNLNNGNISTEELKELESGNKLESSFKKKTKYKTPNFNTFENDFNIDEFDQDLAELRQKAQERDDKFEKQIFASDFDNVIEETLKTIKQDLENSESDEIDDYDPYSESIAEMVKREEEDRDYEKITSTKMKDFKKDDDLSAGLENIDLSDLDNEDW